MVDKKFYGKPVFTLAGYNIRPLLETKSFQDRNRKITKKLPSGKFGIFARTKLIQSCTTRDIAIETLKGLVNDNS